MFSLCPAEDAHSIQHLLLIQTITPSKTALMRRAHSSMESASCDASTIDNRHKPYRVRNETWRLGDVLANRGIHGPTFIALDKGPIRREMCTIWFFPNGRYTRLGDSTMHHLDNKEIVSAATMDGGSAQGFEFLSLEIPRDLLSFEKLREGVFRSLSAHRGDGQVLVELLRSVFVSLASELADRNEVSNNVNAVFAFAAIGSNGLEESDRALLRAARRRAMQRFLDMHSHNADVSAEELSAEFNVSRSEVFRLLELEGGVAKAVARRRINRAAQSLIDSRPERGTVARIAEAAGYREQSHFSRAFRQHLGFSPSEIIGAAAPSDSSGTESIPNSLLSNQLSKMYS
jgi:AraC-like DNA-binding protein